MAAILASIGAELPVLLLRVSAVLLLAVLAHWMLPRRTSAATRHMVWTASLAIVLVLPLATWLVPAWTFEIRRVAATTAPEAVGHGTPVDATAPRRLAATAPVPARASTTRRASPDAGERLGPVQTSLANRWAVSAGAVYVGGVLMVLLRMLAQRVWLRRTCRAASPIDDGPWLDILQRSSDAMQVRATVRLRRAGHLVPMTCGTWRPTVLVPLVADAWDDDRRHAVLLHELAHVVRRDCLTQLVASLACAVAWCHPAAWWVARRMRHERELACDDRVVATGTPARGYAGHLLDIAYAYADVRVPSEALAMARPRQLETRLQALMDVSRNRRPAGRLGTAALIVLAAVALVPTATVTARIVSVAPASSIEFRASASPRASATPAPLVTMGSAPETGMAQAPQTTPRPAPQPTQASGEDSDEGSTGTWSVRPSDTQGTVHLEMRHGRSMSGSSVRVDRFKGLAEALQGRAGAPMRFQLVRDAGTFVYEGVFRDGVGAGTFTFAPDTTFPAALERRGFARPTARQQVQMARHDIGFALIDALDAHRYTKPDTTTLLRAGQHGVTASYVNEMAAVGLALGALDRLITLRDHGVTPTYVREMAALGYKGVGADDLRRARDHGVTPDYVRTLAEAGYTSLPLDAIVEARDHGITGDFLRGLAAAGHRNLPLAEAIRVRDHGGTPEYLTVLREHGHRGPLADLVRARDHGVSQEYLKEMAGLGYKNVPLDTLVRMRDHGVSTAYVNELVALGYRGLTPGQLVSLRDHGFSASRIKRLNDRAGSRLPVEALLEALDGGRGR